MIDSVPYVDPSGDPSLDVQRIPAVVDAALAAVTASVGIDAALAAVTASVGIDGIISELSSTSAPGRAFDITVLMPNGSAVYLELADDLSVVELDLD